VVFLLVFIIMSYTEQILILFLLTNINCTKGFFVKFAYMHMMHFDQINPSISLSHIPPLFFKAIFNRLHYYIFRLLWGWGHSPTTRVLVRVVRFQGCEVAVGGEWWGLWAQLLGRAYSAKHNHSHSPCLSHRASSGSLVVHSKLFPFLFRPLVWYISWAGQWV
jgi:hypothetical protein